MDGDIVVPFGPLQISAGAMPLRGQKGDAASGTHQCPVSEVRDTLQHALTRTSETKGHSQLYGSSAAFRFEVPNRVCCGWCRNLKSAALGRPQSGFRATSDWMTGNWVTRDVEAS